MNTRNSAVGAAVLVAALATTGTALAAGGYGPTQPTGPTNAPGGYTSVVTAQTVQPSGGSLGGPVAGGSVKVTVPAGAFGQPVEVELTSPSVGGVQSALSGVGFAGYRAVAGVGVKVLKTNGQALTGTFGKALSVTLSGANLGVAGEKVLEFTSATTARTVPVTLGSGTVTFTVAADPDLAVVNPPAAAPASGSGGATSVHTGKPFAAETDAGLALAAIGAVAVAAGLRRRRPAER